MKTDSETDQKLRIASSEPAASDADSPRVGNQYCSGCLHHVSQPLTALQGALELAVLAQHGQDESFLERLQDALDQARRLVQWSRSMAHLADQECSQVSLQRISLSDVIDEMADCLRPFAQSRGSHLMVQREQDLCVRANRPHLFQAILNVMDNAIKYSPAGSTVCVTAVRWNGNALLVISDQGPGFSAEEIRHLFEPFFRGREAKRISEGAGMGLAIARQTVNGLGGTLTVENNEDVGASVRIVLPLESPSLEPA